jgi:hypothetical protein
MSEDAAIAATVKARIQECVGRARAASEQKRGHLNALRQLVDECRRMLPAPMIERLFAEIAGVQVCNITMLSEVNGIATEFTGVRAPIAAASMPLFPGNHALLPGAKEWRDGEVYHDRMMDAAGDHTTEEDK